MLKCAIMKVYGGCILKSVVRGLYLGQEGIMRPCRRKTDSKLKFKSAIYWGIDKVTYNKTKNLTANENYHNFLFLCKMGGVIMLALMLASMVGISEYLEKYRLVFGIFGTMFLALAVVFVVYVKEHRRALLPCCYVAAALLLAFAIVMGPVLDSETLSTTFFILLFIIMLLIVDLPVRIGILFVLAGITFVAIVIINKDGMIRVHDLANCAVYLPVSLIIETMMERQKFRQYQLQCQIKKERDTDGLTMLLTRDAGQKTIESMISSGEVKSGSLVMMDLDDFKTVNDTYGHPAGDIVLSAVGEALRQSFRETDILVRFGGDEYMLFLPDISEEEEARVCMEKIRDRLMSITMISGYKQTASFGVALYPKHGDTFEELFARADKALYAAKWRGKDTACIYHKKKDD